MSLDLPQHLERGSEVAAVSEDREVVVERDDLRDSESLHQREGRAIDKREVLVGEAPAYGPGSFQVSSARLFDGRHTPAEPVPERISCSGREEVVDETPTLNQHVIARDKRFGGGCQQ